MSLYETESRDILPWLLLVISIFLILTETTRLPWPEPFQKLTKGRYEFSPDRNYPSVGKRRFNMKMRAFDFRLTDSSRSAGILVATAYFL